MKCHKLIKNNKNQNKIMICNHNNKINKKEKYQNNKKQLRNPNQINVNFRN